jgi:hypothetical protein
MSIYRQLSPQAQSIGYWRDHNQWKLVGLFGVKAEPHAPVLGEKHVLGEDVHSEETLLAQSVGDWSSAN